MYFSPLFCTTEERKMSEMDDAKAYSSMQTGEAFKVYRKTTLGLVGVRILSPFDTTKREYTQLKGDHRDPNCEDCFIELWSEKEHVYFVRANRQHLTDGVLIEYNKPLDHSIKKTPNNMSDEEVDELINSSKFLTLKSKVNQMTSEAAVQRVLDAAEMADRPEGTMKFLRERLALVQSGELDGGNDSD